MANLFASLLNQNMVFFKPKANIGDHEKARIEFQLQELAELIEFERLGLPVLRVDRLLDQSHKQPEEIAAFVANHLAHDLCDFQIQVAIEEKEDCGGGG